MADKQPPESSQRIGGGGKEAGVAGVQWMTILTLPKREIPHDGGIKEVREPMVALVELVESVGGGKTKGSVDVTAWVEDHPNETYEFIKDWLEPDRALREEEVERILERVRPARYQEREER